MANNSLSLVAGAIIVYCVAKKGRRSITPLRLFYLCVGCFMVILAVIAMLVGKYDNICAILLGIVFFIFTYRDKNKPSPGFTIDYSWHLSGYEAGIMLTDYSDLLSELIFHCGVGESLQKWF